jgi:hypothetical protein
VTAGSGLLKYESTPPPCPDAPFVTFSSITGIID